MMTFSGKSGDLLWREVAGVDSAEGVLETMGGWVERGNWQAVSARRPLDPGDESVAWVRRKMESGVSHDALWDFGRGSQDEKWGGISDFKGWVSGSISHGGCFWGIDVACPQTPPPAKHSFAPNRVPKSNLGTRSPHSYAKHRCWRAPSAPRLLRRRGGRRILARN
jgi:hypothetical protein